MRYRGHHLSPAAGALLALALHGGDAAAAFLGPDVEVLDQVPMGDVHGDALPDYPLRVDGLIRLASPR